MKTLTPSEIIMQLIGPTNPVGESHEDNKRDCNLDELIELTDHLISRINMARSCKGDHRHSMNMIGQKADKYLNQLKEELNG